MHPVPSSHLYCRCPLCPIMPSDLKTTYIRREVYVEKKKIRDKEYVEQIRGEEKESEKTGKE